MVLYSEALQSDETVCTGQQTSAGVTFPQAVQEEGQNLRTIAFTMPLLAENMGQKNSMVSSRLRSYRALDLQALCQIAGQRCRSRTAKFDRLQNPCSINQVESKNTTVNYQTFNFFLPLKDIRSSLVSFRTFRSVWTRSARFQTTQSEASEHHANSAILM